MDVLAKSDIDKILLQTNELSIPYDYKAKDYPIDWLIEQFNAKYFFIPPYQRKFVWDNARKCQFIESLLLGIPINPFFVAENAAIESENTNGIESFDLLKDTNVYEIVDGAQRFSTLASFKNDGFILEGLEKLDLLNGFKYSMLPVQLKRNFITRDLRVIIITKQADEKVRSDIFNRLNTSSLQLENSQVRKGAFSGLYYNMILELSEKDELKELCPLSKKKEDTGQYEELVLRYFAYKESYKSYNGKPKVFLDNFVKNQNAIWIKADNWVDLKNKDTSDFFQMLTFIKKSLPNGFRKSPGAKSTPNVRFEALSVGTSLALKEKPNAHLININWLNSKEFNKVTTSDASNNRDKLEKRIEYVRNMILENAQL